MLPTRRSTLLGQIDPLRGRLITVLALVVAGVTLLPTAIAFLFPSIAPYPDPGFSLLLAIEAALALAAAALARFQRSEWAARLLALDLTILPTIEVLNAQAPLESALAGYVGVLLVLAIGTRPFEVLAGTLTVAILGAISVRSQADPRYLAQSLISVSGLLAGTGVVLTWLVEALRRSIVGLVASEAHFHHLSHIDALTGLGTAGSSTTLAGLLSVTDPADARSGGARRRHLKQINDRHGHPRATGFGSVAAAIQVDARISPAAPAGMNSPSSWPRGRARSRSH
jgi:hypothetical protein